MAATEQASVAGSIRGPVRAGITGVGLFFAVLLGWSWFAPLQSATIAPGTVSPEGSVRSLQHLEGGIVEEILVREGEQVQAGQVVLILEDVVARSQRDRLTTRLVLLLATEARLTAERDFDPESDWVPQLPVDDRLMRFMFRDPTLGPLVAAQQDELTIRVAAQRTRIDVLESRRLQLGEQITGLLDQISSQERQLSLIDEEIAGVGQLVSQGLERRPRLLELERQKAGIETQIAANRAFIAQSHQQIGETQLQILDLQSTRREAITAELSELAATITEVGDQLTAIDDVLDRTRVTSPVDGVAVNQTVFTVGGVITPGATFMEIVPLNDRLIIDARVSPTDIDSVRIMAEADVQLSAYANQDLPKLVGLVESLSADAVTDAETGEVYYRARVYVESEDIEQLGAGIRLTPGMPADVMIRSGEQTLIQYLLQPFNRTMERALREG